MKQNTLKHYCIIGAGGIGMALAQLLSDHHHKVTVISRRAHGLMGDITCHNYDVSDPGSVPVLAEMFLQYPVDVVINTIGLLHDDHHAPEKNLQQLAAEWLTKSISANVLAHAYVLQALDHAMEKDKPVTAVAFSARVSSISDNHLGGWYSYRMSKAALNMLIKNVAIEWSRKYKQALLFGYHPGTVDTRLSEPFQARVPSQKLFSPTQAAEYLVSVIDAATQSFHGKLIDWQGKVIEA